MKTAFLTEMGFHGKIPTTNPNMRTEFAWMITLDADHFNIHQYSQVKGYDVVFVIFPKAVVKLNAEGLEMQSNKTEKDMRIYNEPIIEVLKKNNSKVCNVQEGPSWFFNDYDLPTQFNFYNQLAECDVLFAHNENDVHFYKGLFPQSKVATIPTLMVVNDKIPSSSTPEEKAIIGGNFCRWYGGFQSYVVASDFGCPISVPSMHCKRPGEEAVPNLTHLPYMEWNSWMTELSKYKYAVHLMPTVAAGTFSLNCAYYGIPCIGNEKVDTQSELFPELSVDISDIHQARFLALQLKNDPSFYDHVSKYAKNRLMLSKHINLTNGWINHMENILDG